MSMCVISPAALIVLLGMADDRVLHISENFAMAVGVAFLLCLVAVAVFIFIRCGGDVKDMEYLEKEEFETEYAVTHMAKERKIRYAHTYNGGIAIGRGALYSFFRATYFIRHFPKYTGLHHLPHLPGGCIIFTKKGRANHGQRYANQDD